MVAILLAAYPDALNDEDGDGRLPINNAAAYAPLEVFQMIAEMNMANIAAVDHRGDSVTQMTVYHRRLDSLLYIHSIKPELLLQKTWQGTAMMDYLDFDDL